MTGQGYMPEGIRWIARDGSDWMLVTEPGYDIEGWLCRMGPTGLWVTQRKASDEERAQVKGQLTHGTVHHTIPTHKHECQHGHPHDGRCECVCGYEAYPTEEWSLAASVEGR